jgi:cytochrome c oxidase subunit 2
LNRTNLPRLLAVLVLTILVGLLLTGCDADTPQNTFAPEGDVAETQRDVFLLAMWPAIAVMFLVFGVLIVTVLRFRRRSDDEIPTQTHGNTPLEIAWTIAPAVLLAILAIPMLIALFDIGRDPDEDAFEVNVTGIRFLWRFEYPEYTDAEGIPLTSQNELHIPAGREVAINLRSADVIHSFAIPRIAGTRDAIPSADLDGDGQLDHVETFWIRVDEPQSMPFHGQCRELCGTGHANMQITAYAQSQEDLDAWAQEELASRDADGNDEAVAER